MRTIALAVSHANKKAATYESTWPLVIGSK